MRARAIVLLALVALSCREKLDASREEALKTALQQLRAGIASYHKDHGAYPPTLDDLTPTYVRSIPLDPMTNARNWRLDTEENVQPSTDFTTAPAAPAPPGIIDVHSAASGADHHGVPFANY